MDVAKRLEDLVRRKGWAKYQLARKLDLSPSTTNNYLAGRTPDPHICLMLAGIDEPSYRDFWIRASGLTDEQVRLVRKGVQAEAPTVEELQDLASLVSHPQDEEEEHLAKWLRLLLRRRAGTEGGNLR